MAKPLMKLFLEDNNDHEAIALAHIGPSGIQELSQALTNHVITNTIRAKRSEWKRPIPLERLEINSENTIQESYAAKLPTPKPNGSSVKN